MSFTPIPSVRPDIKHSNQIINNRVPLAQQNNHQPLTDDTIVGRTNVQNQTILQPSFIPTTTLDQPLAQKNSHQNYSHVKPRADVKKPRINSNHDQQTINVVSQKTEKSQNVVVPTPQTSSSSTRPYVGTPTSYNAPQQQYNRSEVVVPTPQDRRPINDYVFQPTTYNYVPESSYPVRRPQANSSSLFSLFMSLVLVCTIVAVAILTANKRRW